jgi:biotin carboxyl carrier protein
MFKASVNNRTFEIEKLNDHFVVNGESISPDITALSGTYFSIIHNDKSYRAEVVKIDPSSKTCSIKINGKLIDVALKDKFDLLLEKLGMNNVGAGKVNSIKAPMPGLIVDLRVREGDVVKQNDPLLILEAMKMENIIKSPGDGVVKSVKVTKGASVEKNQILIEF